MGSKGGRPPSYTSGLNPTFRVNTIRSYQFEPSGQSRQQKNGSRYNPYYLRIHPNPESEPNHTYMRPLLQEPFLLDSPIRLNVEPVLASSTGLQGAPAPVARAGPHIPVSSYGPNPNYESSTPRIRSQNTDLVSFPDISPAPRRTFQIPVVSVSTETHNGNVSSYTPQAPPATNVDYINPPLNPCHSSYDSVNVAMPVTSHDSCMPSSVNLVRALSEPPGIIHSIPPISDDILIALTEPFLMSWCLPSQNKPERLLADSASCHHASTSLTHQRQSCPQLGINSSV